MEMQRIIKEKGWEAGITCYAQENKYVILSGHRRWYAAVQLGIQEVPVLLVNAPKDKAEEMERLGSVQGGRVDWTPYEWAKYTYEMWIIWEKCSFKDLGKKMSIDSKQIASRVKVFQYYPHLEIEDKLDSGKYSISALYQLILWLEKLEKNKPELVELFDMNLIRTTMLRKIEMGLVTVDDLRNELAIQLSSVEQIKKFLVNSNFRLTDAINESTLNSKNNGNRFKTHIDKINKAVLNIYQIDVDNSNDAKKLLLSLEGIKRRLKTKSVELSKLLDSN